MKEIVSKIKLKAKQLTLDITQVDEKYTKEQLYNKSLELLLDIHELETLCNQNSPAAQENYASTQKNDRTNDAIIKDEINKIKRRLPIWATKQYQINSKILTLYLKLKDDGNIDITEKMLMEKYNNHLEFNRNFPQMKIISPKNHGKVFDVKNGIIEIWKPVQSIVDEYKKEVFRI